MMAIHRTAVVDAQTTEVVNVIMTDDTIPYEQTEGFLYVDSDTASIGDTYNAAESKFTPPLVVGTTPAMPPPPTQEEIDAAMKKQ